MEEEERLIRVSRKCGDIDMKKKSAVAHESTKMESESLGSVEKEEMKKSAVAHESRKMESTSKFVNVCSANMVTQVRTKQAQVRIARTKLKDKQYLKM